jgi:diacylglycerol kinase (ATP)
MLLVVHNPRARLGRKDPALISRLKGALGDTGTVEAPDGEAALLDTMVRARARGVDGIALLGGDGTGHHVATAVLQAWADAPPPELMWLHGGTMNTVSRSMGQRGRPLAQLGSWVDERRGGPSLERTRRWPLEVNGRHHGFLFGIGVVPRFIEVYESDGRPTPLHAAWTLLRAAASAFTGGPFAERFFRGVRATVHTDDLRWPDRAWHILTAGAVDEIGLSFRPFPGVLTHPGQMHVFASASPPVAFVRDLIPLRLGQPARSPLAQSEVCRRLQVQADEPLRYNLDGELYDAGHELVVQTTVPLTFVLAPGARQPPNQLGP